VISNGSIIPVKRLIPIIGIFFLPILTSCANRMDDVRTTEEGSTMNNPLVAEQYWSELAEHMADFSRNKDPILKNELQASYIEEQRKRGLDMVGSVREKMEEGMRGGFHPVAEPVLGVALVLENKLYFSPTFLTFPNPQAHVYLSSVVDPRDVKFPDPSAMDIGSLLTPYGAQSYTIDPSLRPRTIVIYDRRLERIIGFAQL
jgi:hypothetical protein